MSDDLDRRLLALLRANAREPAVTLARKLKVSRGTVQNRIARMLADRRIQGFTVRAADGQDGVRAVMCIAIEGEQSARVIKALKGFAEVADIHTTNGRWDLVVELNTADLAAFSRALDGIRTIAGIAATETSLLLAQV
ncbi:MAG: AsnC family transcriptional regulator [Alphaproteobacteria bacterium 64-11]|nr:Lrp/AsnC family transcriptional regulator [Alphaproteobacteria bacterium]OJU08613.1 MAG: AsnC family transcriptional regulator [Alphaproteobacteria bacterium 64-11]